MNATPDTASFNRSIYRDFAWFALAAIGVGLAASLTLATAIVLSAPHAETASNAAPLSEVPRQSDTQRM